MNKHISEEQLTAYLLGELDADEIKAVEAILEEQEEARTLLEELRLCIELTGEVFQQEEALALTTEQREKVEHRSDQRPKQKAKSTFGWYLLSGFATAACIFLVAGIYVFSALDDGYRSANIKLDPDLLRRQMARLEDRSNNDGDLDLKDFDMLRYQARELGMQEEYEQFEQQVEKNIANAKLGPDRLVTIDIDGDGVEETLKARDWEQIKHDMNMLYSSAEIMPEQMKQSREEMKRLHEEIGETELQIAELQASGIPEAEEHIQALQAEKDAMEGLMQRLNSEDHLQNVEIDGALMVRTDPSTMPVKQFETLGDSSESINLIVTDVGADPFGQPGNGGLNPQDGLKNPSTAGQQFYAQGGGGGYGGGGYGGYGGGGLQNVEVSGSINIRGNYKSSTSDTRSNYFDDSNDFGSNTNADSAINNVSNISQLFSTIDDATVGADSNKHSAWYRRQHNTEAYAPITENDFKRVTDDPLSTFSIDVDTASYANMRRMLHQGMLPPPDAVRIEELVNYFDYDYAPPEDRETPFAAHVTVAGCPWNPKHRLARVGLKGWELPKAKRPPSNFVFLLDVSGSMSSENKLPLVKRSIRMLTKQLDDRDRVAMVVYAGASGLALESTPAHKQKRILKAITNLEAGGSTNGGAGIELAYRVAAENFIEGGVNRVILATDGDFNVGTTDQGSLTRLIEEKAKSNIFLTVLGYGMGNYKDSTMELLADKGNGNYAYIDTMREAKKVLKEQMTGTLVTIAKDVKIQIEFNPALIGAYRLIGYENRILAAQDFNDDTKDAGEIGAGHTVTALYELVPAGVPVNVPGVDPLKYQKPAQPDMELTDSKEAFTLKLRYKAPEGDTSKLLEFPIVDTDMQFNQADPDFKFAAAVASFGMQLRASNYKGDAGLDNVLFWAENGLGEDTHCYRAEFIDLVRKSKQL